MQESTNQDIVIPRDDGLDIKIVGAKIASASTSPDQRRSNYSGQAGRWATVNLYRTKSGKFICQIIHFTKWEGESDAYYAAVCSDEAEVIAYLGHDRLAKEIYVEAQISAVEVVD